MGWFHARTRDVAALIHHPLVCACISVSLYHIPPAPPSSAIYHVGLHTLHNMQWGLPQQLSTNKLTSYFNPQPQQPQSVFDEFNDITKVSLRKRLMLSVILALVGLAFCGLSTMFMLNPRVFAKFYTLGSISIISSSTILLGWKRQFNTITASSTRFLAVMIYLGSLFITLYVALFIRSSLLTLVCVMFQFGAAVWYALTYIPLGNSIFLKGMRWMLPI